MIEGLFFQVFKDRFLWYKKAQEIVTSSKLDHHYPMNCIISPPKRKIKKSKT